MKIKQYTNGDFGGVTYKTGDFHTTGFSGMSYTTGDFYTNGTSGLGATSVFDALLTPDVKASIKDTAKTTLIDAAKYVWQEYKPQIITAGVLIAAYIALEVSADIKTLTRKG